MQILCLESRMHENVPVRFGRGRLDSLITKGLAAYLILRSLLAARRMFCTLVTLSIRERGLGRSIVPAGRQLLDQGEHDDLVRQVPLQRLVEVRVVGMVQPPFDPP
jgi:hypothetical protein